MDERAPREAPCCFDDWTEDYAKAARGEAAFASPVTRALFEALVETDLSGRTILDIGCGVGDVAMQSVIRGASRAEGFDLSTRMIDEGRRIAAERGLADRVTLHVGDGAQASLPRSDVVVLNRVICCYPDVHRLLQNSLEAAGSVYAFTVPRSRGPVGLFAKLSVRWENLWYALRPRKYGGFRAFVHDVDMLDRQVRAHGFRLARSERRRWYWHLAVYVR